MRFNDIFPDGENEGALPMPNVAFVSGEEIGEITEQGVRGIICNPVYAGVGPFPALISDEQWVRAVAKLVDEEGTEQFLVNLLFVLRKTFPADS